MCRASHKVDSILSDFHFHERAAFVAAYPHGLHKVDRMVCGLVTPCRGPLLVCGADAVAQLAGPWTMPAPRPACCSLMWLIPVLLQGRPVLVYKLGAVDLEALKSVTSDSRMTLAHIQVSPPIV